MDFEERKRRQERRNNFKHRARGNYYHRTLTGERKKAAVRRANRHRGIWDVD